MADILGTTTDELIGKPSFEDVYPEEAAAAQRLVHNKQRGDSPVSFQAEA